MVEKDRLLHSDAVYDAKRCKARREHDVDQWDEECKKLWDGRNRRKDYHRALSHILTAADIKNSHERERENNIDPDYQTHVLGILRAAGMNDPRKNETENARDKNLERERIETNHDNVLPLVQENDEINDRGKRKGENVDEDGYDSDVDPEFQNVLGCLKEYGNAYALEDQECGLIIYEEESSSDDFSEHERLRKKRMNRKQETNVNSVNENPRVESVEKNVNERKKGILRKRKNIKSDCSGSKERVEIRVYSRKSVNRKPIEFASNYFERNSRKMLKEKNVAEEEDDDDDDDYDDAYDYDDDDFDANKYYFERNPRKMLKEKNVAEEEEEDDDDGDDYDDAYDYDDDFDVNKYYFVRNPRKMLKEKNVAEDDDDDDGGDDDFDVNKYYFVQNPRIISKGTVKEDDDLKKKVVIQQNKEYLYRRRSPRFNLVIEDEKPNLGKLKKMDKGKNVVSEDNESKPSRPYKKEMVQSRKNLKTKVKQENKLKKVVEESDSDEDYTDLEILDCSEVIREGNCFDPSKIYENGAGGSNGCADYRRRVLLVLNEPYDANEYRRLSEEVKVYLETFPDLKRKLGKYRYRRGTRLTILRGFFYWLQNNPHLGAFKPWKDAECLSINPKDLVKT